MAKDTNFYCCVVSNGQEKCTNQCQFCKDWVEDAEDQENNEK